MVDAPMVLIRWMDSWIRKIVRRRVGMVVAWSREKGKGDNARHDSGIATRKSALEEPL